MSPHYTRSSNMPNNTRKSRVTHSVQSSRLTTRSCLRMDWTQIMIRSIYDSFSGWVTDERTANRSSKPSRRYSTSSEYRLNSIQRKTAFRKSQEILQALAEILVKKRRMLLDRLEAHDERRSLQRMMLRMKARGSFDLMQTRELRCRDCRQVRRRPRVSDLRPGRPRGRQRGPRIQQPQERLQRVLREGV